MTVTKLMRRKLKKCNVRKQRVKDYKKANWRPVIKHVNIEEIEKSFKK